MIADKASSSSIWSSRVLPTWKSASLAGCCLSLADLRTSSPFPPYFTVGVIDNVVYRRLKRGGGLDLLMFGFAVILLYDLLLQNRPRLLNVDFRYQVAVVLLFTEHQTNFQAKVVQISLATATKLFSLKVTSRHHQALQLKLFSLKVTSHHQALLVRIPKSVRLTEYIAIERNCPMTSRIQFLPLSFGYHSVGITAECPDVMN